MAKKKQKAKRRGDSFQRRMASMLARHGLTIDQAGRLSDADLRRRKGIGRTMIAVIRAAAGPAPPPTRDAPVTERGARDHRIAALEHQVAELLEAVRQLQGLLRARGVDRRRYPPSEQATRHLRKGDTPEPPKEDRPI